MIDPKPFKTHTHTAYYTVEDYHTRELSLAVEVIDEFTGMLPAIPFRLKLAMQVGEKFFEIMSAVVSRSSLSQTRGPRLVRTASDYLCYLDLPEGTYQLEVEGDPVKGPWYFPAKLEAVIPLPPARARTAGPVKADHPEAAAVLSLSAERHPGAGNGQIPGRQSGCQGDGVPADEAHHHLYER